MFEIPTSWQRGGLVLPRAKEQAGQEKDGEGWSVVGDPCIVWDEELDGWRMFLFYDPPGHGHAICRDACNVGPGQWELLGPLQFSNPEALLGGATHKPFVVMDAHRPNHAAKINGRFCLVSVSFLSGHKVVQQAWAEHLAGPWEVVPEPLIANGAGADFDAKHADAVSGFYFPERGEILYFYMGYPQHAQPRKISPYGSAQGVAVQQIGEAQAVKLGEMLPPCQQDGHWASGYLGGLQILSGKMHRWIAIINASPTAPDPTRNEIWAEEPAPSLGGFAWCDEEFPIKNWHWCAQPIEWIEQIPLEAHQNGEGTNLWRQHLLALPDGKFALFYNSGFYGQEQLYLKLHND